ncbi:MAG: hypothetical protein KJ906_03130 [Nanoarchaeota archaeon]|nr:hypothetical protein [Nanoarchaeota archaeon]
MGYNNMNDVPKEELHDFKYKDNVYALLDEIISTTSAVNKLSENKNRTIQDRIYRGEFFPERLNDTPMATAEKEKINRIIRNISKIEKY